MGGIRFPTSPDPIAAGKHAMRGEPIRARGCRCGPRQQLDQDGLCLCGYWPESTIDETWRRQAKRTRDLEYVG